MCTQKIFYRFVIFKTVTARRNNRKTEKDETEARQSQTPALRLAVFQKHGKKNPDEGKNHEIFSHAGNADGYQNGCYRRTDVGTHDNGGRLIKAHHARVYETDDHNRRRARALHKHRRPDADSDSGDFALRRFIEKLS